MRSTCTKVLIQTSTNHVPILSYTLFLDDLFCIHLSQQCITTSPIAALFHLQLFPSSASPALCNANALSPLSLIFVTLFSSPPGMFCYIEYGIYPPTIVFISIYNFSHQWSPPFSLCLGSCTSSHVGLTTRAINF